jgi:hypothetical protein
VLQPDSIALAGKSFIVQRSIACNLKFFLVAASLVLTPLFQSSLSSSIRGLKYTSISIPGDFGPGINIDKPVRFF